MTSAPELAVASCAVRPRRRKRKQDAAPIRACHHSRRGLAERSPMQRLRSMAAVEYLVDSDPPADALSLAANPPCSAFPDVAHVHVLVARSVTHTRCGRIEVRSCAMRYSCFAVWHTSCRIAVPVWVILRLYDRADPHVDWFRQVTPRSPLLGRNRAIAYAAKGASVPCRVRHRRPPTRGRWVSGPEAQGRRCGVARTSSSRIGGQPRVPG